MKAERLGRLEAYYGEYTQGSRPPTCPVCRLPMLKGQKGLCIKFLGEIPKHLHAECLPRFIKWLQEIDTALVRET